MIMKIVPINIPIKGVMDTLEIHVNSFELFPSTVQLYYILSGDNGRMRGNLDVPADVVDQWGTDDTIIVDYVLNQLGVQLDETESN